MKAHRLYFSDTVTYNVCVCIRVYPLAIVCFSTAAIRSGSHPMASKATHAFFLSAPWLYVVVMYGIPTYIIRIGGSCGTVFITLA